MQGLASRRAGLLDWLAEGVRCNNTQGNFSRSLRYGKRSFATATADFSIRAYNKSGLFPARTMSRPSGDTIQLPPKNSMPFSSKLPI